MKKFLTTILLVLYLIPTVGMSLCAKTCEMNKISEAKKCVCSSKNEKKDCCKEKKITFKLKDSQQKAEFASEKLNNIISAEYIVANTTNFSIFLPVVANLSYPLPRPPDLFEQSLYLSNRVLRI